MSAKAQDLQIIRFPEIGVDSTIAAGSEIYSYARLYTIDGVQLEVDSKAGSWMLEKPVARGTKLISVSTKAKFKACAPAPGELTGSGPCFIDDDGDGRFDRQSADEVEMARKLKVPAAYTKTKISVVREDAFKSVLLYQGATSDTLRFSYREFKNDIARPAFTEELTIPRETFPAMIMVKNIQLEVLGVTGMGLHYKVVKVR